MEGFLEKVAWSLDPALCRRESNGRRDMNKGRL